MAKRDRILFLEPAARAIPVSHDPDSCCAPDETNSKNERAGDCHGIGEDLHIPQDEHRDQRNKNHRIESSAGQIQQRNGTGWEILDGG